MFHSLCLCNMEFLLICSGISMKGTDEVETFFKKNIFLGELNRNSVIDVHYLLPSPMVEIDLASIYYAVCSLVRLACSNP